jgi:DNA-directed RNA polymerase specialized sigma24 family protein
MKLTDREIQFYKFALILSCVKLSPKRFSSMIYHYAFKMPYREIARLEGCSWQAIHNRVQNALKQLRRSSRIKDFF